jgi:hypothetical protein
MRPHDPHVSRAGIFLFLALALALASCTTKQPETQTTTTTTETHTVHVKSIDLGNTLSSDRRVVTTDRPLAPRDTLYAAVDLDGPAPASQVTARWVAADGTVVSETTQQVPASDTEGVAQFQFAPPAGLAPGTYKMEIVVDGQVVSTKEFTVAAP